MVWANTVAHTVTIDGSYNIGGTTSLSGSALTVDFDVASVTGGLTGGGLVTGDADITANDTVSHTNIQGNGKLFLNGGYSNGGNVTLARDTDNNVGSTFSWNNGNITGGPFTFENKAGATFDVLITSSRTFNAAGGDFNNAGLVTTNHTGGTTAVIPTTFVNDGTIQTNSGILSLSGAFTQNVGGKIIINGGDLTLSSPTFNGGSIEGGNSGTLNATVNTAGGPVTISPGMSIDTLSINGSVTLDSDDTVVIELAGGSSFDVLDVASTFDVSGSSIEINFLDGFSASMLDVFPIITAGTLVGQFANLPEGTNSLGAAIFDVSYAGNQVTLSNVFIVPEPSSLTLLVLVGLTCGRWRRSRPDYKESNRAGSRLPSFVSMCPCGRAS